MCWLKIYNKMDSWVIFKTISFIYGLFGLVLTWTEVKSYGMFQEQLSNAYDLDLGFVKNVWIKDIYKISMIFVILTRKYTWYPYIIAYFFMLFAIVFDLKRFFALWLFISAIRSVFVNIFVALTGLWFGYISCINKLTLLDFVLFKIIQLVVSVWFWHRILSLYRNAAAVKVFSSRLSRKRRASFHGFDLKDRSSTRSSLFRSILDEDSASEFLAGPSHRSDYEFLNAARRSPSLDDLVNRKMIDWFVDEANLVDEEGDDESSSYSFDLAARAQKFLQLTPEELAKASTMKPIETTMERRMSSINQLLKLQPLPAIDFWDEKSEMELNAVDMSEAIKKESKKIRDQMPFTPESFLGIFYKYHYYTNKPSSSITEESENESSEEVINAEESNEHENAN